MREGQNHSAAWGQVGDSGKGWESRGGHLQSQGKGPGRPAVDGSGGVE